MFGYITINKPELKIREYDLYQSYYCGLCEALKREHGQRGRLTVSYDLNFVVMLLSGLYEHEDEHLQKRCIAHPFRKNSMILNEFSYYGADMNVFLTYLKCEDDWIDEKKRSRRMFAGLLKKSVKSVRERYPEKCADIEKLMDQIRVVENEGDQSIDRAAGLFGEIMADVLMCRDDEWSDELHRVGFYLGKFIYLMDAYEDIEDDVKTGNYNPFRDMFLNSADFEDRAYEILTMMMAECSRGFEILPIIDNADILRNILYAGVWSGYERVKRKRKEADNV